MQVTIIAIAEIVVAIVIIITIAVVATIKAIIKFNEFACEFVKGEELIIIFIINDAIKKENLSNLKMMIFATIKASFVAMKAKLSSIIAVKKKLSNHKIDEYKEKPIREELKELMEIMERVDLQGKLEFCT